VTPTPKPFHTDGVPLVIIPRENYSEGMMHFEVYARWMALELIKRTVSVMFAGSPDWSPLACYGKGELHINVPKLGKAFFTGTLPERIEKWSNLLIHEFAHEYESNHLSEDYYRACSRLGGKLARLIFESGYKEAQE
jgi:hypothetical protein